MKKIVSFLLASLLAKNTYSQVSFAPYQPIPTGSKAQVVAIGDLNNDGLNDVAVGIGYSNDPNNDYKLQIFHQNGSGLLDPAVKYSYPPVFLLGVSSISIADLNNDNLNDVVLGCGDSIKIFFQDLSGSLSIDTTFYVASGIDALKAGDLNNDGLADIATCPQYSSYLKIFYQVAGGFNEVDFPKTSGNGNELDINDMNDDGLNDLIYMSGSASASVHIYIQNGSGSFNNPITYFLTPGPVNILRGIGTGDLNNDGKNDLVATKGGNTPDSRVVIWYQDAVTGLLQNAIDTLAYDIPVPVETGDLNCDGKNEIIVGHNQWSHVSVFEQNVSGTIGGYTLFQVPYSAYLPQSLCVGDINNDNKMDIVLAEVSDGLVCLYNNTPVTCNPSVINNFFPDKIDFNIFPNPSSGIFKINFQSNLSQKTIQIFDVTGNIIYQKDNINNKEEEINLTHQPKGIYFLKVFDKDKITVNKIVVE